MPTVRSKRAAVHCGKVYLSPIIDCFDGIVISWSIGTQPHAGLVNTMLDAAIGTVTDGQKWPIIRNRCRIRTLTAASYVLWLVQTET